MKSKLPEGFSEAIEAGYDKLALKGLSKHELIDIVHKAKCGKLKGLDTEPMSKEDIVKHLLESKCPEIHKLIMEYKELNDNMAVFLEKFIKVGSKIDTENIYYMPSGIFIDAFIIEAFENKKLDCLIIPDKSIVSGTKREYSFSLEIITTPSNKRTQNLNFSYEIITKLIEQIDECIKSGTKLIAIPFVFYPVCHQNLLLYRVDNNQFERFEPHGQYFNNDKEDIDNKKVNKALADLCYKLKPTSTFISPDLWHPAQQGFQTSENYNLHKLPLLRISKEEYKKRIGGFCVMWSCFYLNLVLEYPDTESADIIKAVNKYMEKYGDKGFFDLIIGYLQPIEILMKRYLRNFKFKDFNFIDFNANKNSKKFKDFLDKNATITGEITDYLERVLDSKEPEGNK